MILAGRLVYQTKRAARANSTICCQNSAGYGMLPLLLIWGFFVRTASGA
jgi:hypothetical protein